LASGPRGEAVVAALGRLHTWCVVGCDRRTGQNVSVRLGGERYHMPLMMMTSIRPLSQ